MNNMQRDLRRKLNSRQAYRRVLSIKNFYMRLGVYCTVNAIFLLVWIFGPSLPYDFWMPTLFFTTFLAGLFIVSNAIVVFGEKYFFSKKWEQRKLTELVHKQQEQTIKYK